MSKQPKAWKDDQENFTVPAEELPTEIERLIPNQKPVKNDSDALTIQQQYLSENKFDAFLAKYEFASKHRVANPQDKKTQNFIATYKLKEQKPPQKEPAKPEKKPEDKKVEPAQPKPDGPPQPEDKNDKKDASKGKPSVSDPPKENKGGDKAAQATPTKTGKDQNLQSTNAYTAASRLRDRSQGDQASQGLWRSYYAQQRERDTAPPTAHSRVVEHQVYEADHGNTYDYRDRVNYHMKQLSVNNGYERVSRSPLRRSNSPQRSYSPSRHDHVQV